MMAAPTNEMTREMPPLPIRFSPHVSLSRLPLRSMAFSGPTPSAANTGTTRKVATVHASPAPNSISLPIKPSFSAMSRSSTPTVAEISA
jgi:hypothetical protein